MSLQDLFKSVADNARARARERHEAAGTYLETEAAPAFEDVRSALGEAEIDCTLEIGEREARLLLGDGQSLRLTLHTDATRCDVWIEAHAYPSPVVDRLWTRRWRIGEPSAWPNERVTALLAEWIAALPNPPAN